MRFTGSDAGLYQRMNTILDEHITCLKFGVFTVYDFDKTFGDTSLLLFFPIRVLIQPLIIV